MPGAIAEGKSLLTKPKTENGQGKGGGKKAATARYEHMNLAQQG